MKKIIFTLMILSSCVTFLLLNDSSNLKIHDYRIGKTITVSEKFKVDANPYKVYDGLKNIETKYKIRIIKVSNFNNDNNIEYNINTIGNHNFKQQETFNKNVKVTITNEKIQDRDVLGIYYFSDYNSNVENSLLDLGLISTNYNSMSIVRSIILTLYDNYFYIVLIILIIFTAKISYTHSKSKKRMRERFSLNRGNKIFIILLLFLHLALLYSLWLYNQWHEIFKFIGLYIVLFVSTIILLSTIYVILYNIFSKKFAKKLYNKFSMQVYLFFQSICIIFLYLLLVIFSSVISEVYLGYFNNPLQTVSQYSTTDLTSFNPGFYEGEKKVNDFYKEFISKQDNIILSAYNIGYDFSKNNYDPYSGNSLLTSPKYFETQDIKDYRGKTFKFSDVEKNKINIIIPTSQKHNIEKIKEEYTNWMSFISDIPVKKLDVNIYYSQKNQDVYSYGYQNSIRNLKLNSPVIMVINPMALTPEVLASFMSNRFVSFKLNTNLNSIPNYTSYFAQISKISYLMKEDLFIMIVRGINLLLTLYIIVLLILEKTNMKVTITDRLIWYIFTLTFIILMLPFEKYSMILVLVLMVYILMKKVVVKYLF